VSVTDENAIANCRNLQNMISDVQKVIAKAIAALEHMKNAFSQLQTDIEFITKRLDRIDDKMIDSDSYEREKSLKDFEGARWRWVLVCVVVQFLCLNEDY
jgi:predicted  nucleic acid-binding Zn-ribbon protein